MSQPPQEILDRVLESSGADRFDLPPLVDAPDDSPSWLVRLLKWLESFFPKPDPNSHAGQFFPLLVKGLIVLLVILVVVMAVSWVFSALRRRRGGAPGARLPSGEDPRERLELFLESALRAGRTGEAARLRWKLHLLRKALPSSITPGETQGFARFYPLMFGPAGESGGELSLKLFGELDLCLREREAETR